MKEFTNKYVFLYQIEDIGPDLHGLYPFTITYSNKHMVVAAQSEEEKYKWLEVRNSNVNFSVAITINDILKTVVFCPPGS